MGGDVVIGARAEARPALLRRARLGGPLLALLIGERRLATAAATAAVVYLAGTAAGLSVWPCPFRAVTGLPCPGCGLTRAMLALLQGGWRHALALHAFAPFFLAGLALLLVSAVLPRGAAARLTNAVEVVERRTGLTRGLLVAAAVYGIARLVWTAACGW